MSLKPLPAEQVQPTLQSLLGFLDSENVLVPGNLNEHITSAKSLCRAILAGQLVVCANVQQPQPEPEAPEEEKPEPEEKTPRKKAPRKKAGK